MQIVEKYAGTQENAGVWANKGLGLRWMRSGHGGEEMSGADQLLASLELIAWASDDAEARRCAKSAIDGHQKQKPLATPVLTHLWMRAQSMHDSWSAPVWVLYGRLIETEHGVKEES